LLSAIDIENGLKVAYTKDEIYTIAVKVGKKNEYSEAIPTKFSSVISMKNPG
jgi:hypothetical protein